MYYFSLKKAVVKGRSRIHRGKQYKALCWWRSPRAVVALPGAGATTRGEKRPGADAGCPASPCEEPAASRCRSGRACRGRSGRSRGLSRAVPSRAAPGGPGRARPVGASLREPPPAEPGRDAAASLLPLRPFPPHGPGPELRLPRLGAAPGGSALPPEAPGESLGRVRCGQLRGTSGCWAGAAWAQPRAARAQPGHSLGTAGPLPAAPCPGR